MPTPPILRLAVFTVLAAVLPASGTYAEEGAKANNESTVHLDFGLYSSNKPSAMVRVFKPVLNRLEELTGEKLGRPVDIRMQIAKDYDEGVSDLTSGEVDFSQFGPASYIEAKRANSGLRILAMESIKEAKVFYGIIAVRADSDIRSIEDLKGRSFAFGDEASTIGRFLSQLYLEEHGLHADDFSNYDYLGRHDKVGTAVGAGDFDAGALNEKTFQKLVASGEPLRELARFANVTKPWIASSTLDPVVFDALQQALLELDDERALKNLKVDGFLEGSDEDYRSIRTAMEENDRFFTGRTPAVATSESLVANVHVERGNDVRLKIELPREVFDDVGGLAGGIVIELVPVGVSAEAAPEAAAALPDPSSADAAGDPSGSTTAAPIVVPSD